MDIVKYEKLNKYFTSKPMLAGFAAWSNLVLTAAVYAAYPILLAVLAIKKQDLIRAVLVPLIPFLAVSILRLVINKKRPYEKSDLIKPLNNKTTEGKSMPSRHSFSVFVIAVIALYYNLYLGICLLAVGVLLAAARIILGVHYISDVLVGAFLGVLSGYIGMYLI